MTARLLKSEFVVVLAMFGGISGCESGVQFGPWSLIEPRPPLNANRIEVTRQLVGHVRSVKSSPKVKLRVDLETGRASLTDPDDQVHLVELNPELTATLRSGIENRSWQIWRRNPPRDAEQSLAYEMFVYVEDQPLHSVARWHNPAAKSVPSSLQTVMSVFDSAARYVRPLSNTINLID